MDKRNYNDEKKNEEMGQWLKYTAVGVLVLVGSIFMFCIIKMI